MSTLLIEDLKPGIVAEQPFKVPYGSQVAHVRPWIMRYNTILDGDFTCEIWQGATLLATSVITSAELNTIPGPYFHGYVRFDFNVTAQVDESNTDEEYILKFYMDNHTFAGENYVALCRDWDTPKYVVYGDVDESGNPVNDTISPYGIEIHEYRSI